MEDEGVDELSTISGAHRSHREYREGARQPAAAGSLLGDSPRDGNTGIGIQFKTNPSSGILYVTSILKDGPSQNRGIITGDIVAEVDGVDVLNRGEGQKPWPFERVSPLIKGAPGSVVTIAFLRPVSTEQEDDTAKIPEGQLFRVKIRRQDKRSSADLSGMSPRSQQAQQPPAPLGNVGAGPLKGEKGGPPSPPASARLANDDDSDMGRADLSIEARLRAHARGAVNAAAMARKLMTSSGTLKSSIISPSRPGGGERTVTHQSLPASAGGALREEIGRRVHSDGWGQGVGASRGADAGPPNKKQPVSAAERMQIAQDLAAQQREIRLRMRALHVPAEDEGKRKEKVAAGDDTWQVTLQPVYPEKVALRARSPAAEQLPAKVGAGVDEREGSGDKSNREVLSAKELQELDRARILKRLITSRTSRPHSTIKGYGEHQSWLEEVEARRKSARARPSEAPTSARREERQELKPQQPTKWHEECIEMVGQCRNCVTQAIKAI